VKEEAIVESAGGGRATVRLIRPAACEKCRVCRESGKESSLLEAENSPGATVGQKVTVSIDDSLIAKATFIFYGVPFLGFIIGVLLGRLILRSEIQTLLFAFGVTAFFYALNRKLVRVLASGINIKITAISN